MTDNIELDIASMTIEELTANIKSMSAPAFRAKQIYGWIHQKLISDVDEMTNIPVSLREKLRTNFRRISQVTRLISKEDGTNKFLFRLYDGNVIESVLMKYKHGNSVCISSQVGCRMGCRFCASTIGGLVRNLSAGEMLSQIYSIQKITGERVSNVVVMGTGEPLDNYENLIRFIRLLNSEQGLNISQRNITVSSCGLVPEIKKLADEKLSITFALSLHASDDAARKKLMPIANQYTIEECLDACDYYFEKTGRRVTFEYSLVMGENDSSEHAARLAGLIKGKNCHVNLIPVNPIKEREYCRSSEDSIEKFKYILEKNQINVTIRRSMGRDIDAACGQLRRKYEEVKNSL
ncbi:MAG: 23S rRNA (adenine(2503)-C(2))-methyltransferase RlmN [Coprococcus sp.]|nr:23S rRNA (adenine(2503)-C(2))-methyltransferase RlmN [Coprococcus sp.]